MLLPNLQSLRSDLAIRLCSTYLGSYLGVAEEATARHTDLLRRGELPCYALHISIH